MKNYILLAFLGSFLFLPSLFSQEIEYQPKNRIGIEFGEAFGFQSIRMVEYANGSTSDMKFGDCTGLVLITDISLQNILICRLRLDIIGRD